MTTGCLYLDKLISTLEKDVVTTIFGSGGSGKTCTCMMVAAEVAKKGGKVIYVDTEGGFSVERFKQLTGTKFEELLNRIIFLRPTSFEEQKKSFEKLKEKITEDIKLVVVDTIAMLYRLELGKGEEMYETNRELGRQISSLTEIARRLNIPVLMTNQVYTNLETGRTKMVGGDILVYGSKCLIELEKGKNGIRKAILRKHRSIAEDIEVSFRLVQKGMTYNSE